MMYVWVAIGGAIGSVARFWGSEVVARLIGETFPWGTIIVNIVGSFVIGFAATAMGPDGRMFAGATPRQFVMAGLCGGFTTFSSFSLQTLTLVNDGEWGKPSYATYIKDRLNGFGGTATTTYVFQDIEALPQTKARVAADPGRKHRKAPACNAPISVRDVEAPRTDADRLKTALKAHGAAGGFLTAASPDRLTAQSGGGVDAAEKIDGFLPVLDSMMTSGLVTLEKVQVLQYGADGVSPPAE